MAKKTWADEELDRLHKIIEDGGEWTVEDWETYSYIQNVNAESNYYDSLD